MADTFGDALRKFYKTFGMENEGPPVDTNVTKLTELFSIANFAEDIILIERICNNSEVVKKHNECKELIEFVANSLGDSSFMSEINDSIIDCSNSDKEHLTNGMFWHYLGSVIDPKIGNELGINIPFPGELPQVKQELLKVQGSLIFRLYITLVYMKEGPSVNLLNQTARNRKPIAQKVKKLLQCDYVRHLRNALSHSSFESTSFGIYFKDGDKGVVKFETVASPEFLNSLTTWIMLIHLQCSSVIDLKRAETRL